MNLSPFNTANRLASKLKSKYDWEVSRTTITRFLVQKWYKWKGPEIVFRNNEQDQKSRYEFCKKNKDRSWKNVILTDEASVYLCSPGKNRWVRSGDSYKRTKTKYSNKVHVWAAFSTKGPIKLQFFTGNKDSIKYIDTLKQSKVEIDELHPDVFYPYVTMTPNIDQGWLSITILWTTSYWLNGQPIAQI